MKTIMIAEIGENHIGDMSLAKKMVEEAAKAGAHYAKFQSYRGQDVADSDPEKQWFTRVELSNQAHKDLKRHAEACGVRFMSSPFTIERARFLCEELGLEHIKIGSSEMTNGPLLDYVARHAKVVFLSTGASTLDEVGVAVQALRAVPKVYVLHCVSEYPLPEEKANLQVIQTLRARFKVPVGYSDHTKDILAPVIAVALGAEVIEKHFTLDKSLEGTDHILSATPTEFREMVRQIGRVESLLGSPEKQMSEVEKVNYRTMRRRFKKVAAQ